MMGRLQDRVALIAGAGAGIGRRAAVRFAQEGACVALVDIDESALRAGADEAVAASSAHRVSWATADVTDERRVEDAFEKSLEQFGRLDILFNCAGGSVPQDDTASRVDPVVWHRTIGLDLNGTWLCCRQAIPRMITSGGGAIVNMASGAALRGSNPAHAYSAAKGAVVSLTRAIAGAHARDGIRANAICAGRIDTERIRRSYGTPGQPGPMSGGIDANREAAMYPFWFGTPDDIACIAIFLASDESRMITGAAIPADGGRSAY